tara:strand:- start:816 stop:1052 length:237 start_codon:yes stop_codon:yes gene_type:complete
MEMLNLGGLMSAAILGFLGWLGMNVVELKTELAVTHEKVSNTEERVTANYEMIKPMWQEFIMEKNVANIALTNASTNK